MKKEFNVGIGALRVLMCFEVVLCHFYPFDEKGALGVILGAYSSLAVPIFMILAFLFSDVYAISNDRQKYRERMSRLIIPYLFWGLLYFFSYWVVDKIFDYKLGLHKGLKGVVALIFTGGAINTAMWFTVDLVIITILFSFICTFMSHERAKWIIMLLGIGSIILQYSGLWFLVVDNVFKGTPLYWTIGRIPEMIPLAAVGIMLKEKEILQSINTLNKRTRTIIFDTCFLVIILLFFIPQLNPEKGFMYGGFNRIIQATLTVICFGMLCFGSITKKVKNSIIILSKHTMAVYYMHNLIGTLLFKTGLADSIRVEADTLFACIIIFIFSMACAILFSKIPIKIVKISMA